MNASQEIIWTDSLKILWQRMTDDERTRAGEIFDFYLEQFRALAKTRDDNPLGLAVGVHEAIDEEIARHRANDPQSTAISCAKGCAYCCELHVDVMPDRGRVASQRTPRNTLSRSTSSGFADKRRTARRNGTPYTRPSVDASSLAAIERARSTSIGRSRAESTS